VAIESVNPDLVPSGSGEAAIAAFVATWLRTAGLDEVSVVDAPPGRPSVVGIVRGSGGGRSLMLNAHMDTVGAGGMSSAFSPRVAQGRVYGRGAYDMKASLAAIMLTARRARELKLKGDLMITAVADEEVASAGTSAVLDQFRADFGIVTEPTELRLCLAHKGFVWLEVETVGVATHGSRADLGVDAIAAMGPVLARLQDLENTLRLGRRHQLLGTGSIHASLIEGGQEMSTYPSRCVLKIERRTIPGDDVSHEIEGARVTLERPPSEVAPDHPLAMALARAAGDPVIIGVSYWMDMALLNAAGIPCVAYGPLGEGEHADVEWVDVASVEECVEVYLRAASLLCGA
jgi:acetylornithine deacetylase/succinyl-diaminopimelate desuccinylase-like protein